MKSIVSIHKFCRTTPVLKAMGINTIEMSVDVFNLELLRSIFTTNSRARSFYMHELNNLYCDRSSSQPGLLSRVQHICGKYDVQFLKYIFDRDYSSQVKRRLKMSNLVNDGLSDSVRLLLISCDPYDKMLLNMLLIPF